MGRNEAKAMKTSSTRSIWSAARQVAGNFCSHRTTAAQHKNPHQGFPSGDKAQRLGLLLTIENRAWRTAGLIVIVDPQSSIVHPRFSILCQKRAIGVFEKRGAGRLEEEGRHIERPARHCHFRSLHDFAPSIFVRSLIAGRVLEEWLQSVFLHLLQSYGYQ